MLTRVKILIKNNLTLLVKEVVKFGLELVPQTAIEKIVNYAILAEEGGLDTVWITDHFYNRNTYVTLTAIALKTKRVLIGPGVTNPYVVNPVWTASAIASLDEISGGRVLLGIGAGDRVTLEKLSIPQAVPLAAIKESVTVIRELLRGNNVTFEGKFLKIRNARLSFKPERDVPIYIGAQGPKMLKLASRIGDGVLINASNPKDFEYASEIIKKAAGDRLDSLDIVAYTCFSVDYDREVARSKVVPIVAFIVAGAPEMVLERHGINKDKAARIKEALGKGDFKEAFKHVTEDMVKAFSIYGTPEDCIAAIEELTKVHVTHIVFGSPLGAKKKKAIEIVSREIVPAFK